MYDDIPSLMAEVSAGEDTFLEFKEVVFQGSRIRFARQEGRAQQTIAEVFASMANTEGGVVIFGINNDRQPVGIDPEKQADLEQWIIQVCRDLPRPPLSPVIDWLQLPDATGSLRLCLKVTIPKNIFAVVSTWDQRPIKRVGSHRQAIQPDELARIMARRNQILPCEERPVLTASVSDLDAELFETYYVRRFGVTCAEKGTTVHEVMRRFKLLISDETGGMHPTTLGMLLFGKEPQYHILFAFVDIASYTNLTADGNAADTKKIEGRLPEQIETILRYFQSSALIATRSTKDATGRRDTPLYSYTALQEALVNAIVHRDYDISGSQIRIFMYPDRIEFWNPGALHNTLREEDLYAGCQPVRRNQLLAGFFRDFHSPLTGRSFMEARGEGFLNMVAECERVSGKKPDLKITGQAIRLTIFAGSE